MPSQPAENETGPPKNGEEERAGLAEVAERFRLSEDQLHRWIASGNLRAFRDRGEVFLRIRDVLRFLDRPGVPSSPETEPQSVAGDAAEDAWITLPELSLFLGVPTAEIEALLQEGPFALHEGADGEKRLPRREVARLFLGSATRRSILEAAEDVWGPGGEPPQAESGEGVEDQDEEATEETCEGAPEEEDVLRGAVSIRFYDRMVQNRSFPFVVQGARLQAPVRAVPRLPGCIVMPQGVDLTPENPRGEFWVTPHALGPVPKAGVDFFFRNGKIGQARTPVAVRNLFGVWVTGLLAGAFLVLSPFLEALEGALAEESAVGAVLETAGGGAALALFASLACFAGATLWFFLASPREGRPVTVSLSGGED